MSATTNIVGTVGIVTLGRWANDESLDSRVIFGAAIVALGVSAIGERSPKLASQVSALILVTAFMIYSRSIWKWAGMSDHRLTMPRNSGPGGGFRKK